MSESPRVDPFGDPALADVMSSVAERLERRGLAATGRFTLTGLTRESRQALGGLLGRRLTGERLSVDLAELDGIARERVGLAGGLVEACEAALDRRLVDIPAQRERRRRARDEPVDAMRAAVDAWPSPPAWAEEWVDAVARLGLLTRAAHPVLVAQQATTLVGHLVMARERADGGDVRLARNELAARFCGDAHALDDGTVLSAVVLRGLALAVAQPAPRTARDRRELWRCVDVDLDGVSTTAMTVGLRFDASDTLARRLDLAAAEGDPLHLTARNVAALAGARPVTSVVLVCENPRVLEAAAGLGSRAAAVCTMGNPSTVVVDLLRVLARAGCRLDYHGDFDWAGIAIAGRVCEATGARPWRMHAADYLSAVADARGLLALDGVAVATPWDPGLRAAMLEVGLAVHEESLLPGLVQEWLQDRGASS